MYTLFAIVDNDMIIEQFDDLNRGFDRMVELDKKDAYYELSLTEIFNKKYN